MGTFTSSPSFQQDVYIFIIHLYLNFYGQLFIPQIFINPLELELTKIGKGSQNSNAVISHSSAINRAYNFPVSNSQTAIRPLLDPLTKIDILDE